MFKERKRAKPTHLRHKIHSPSLNSRAAAATLEYTVSFHVLPARLSDKVAITVFGLMLTKIFFSDRFQEKPSELLRSLLNVDAAVSPKQYCFI